MRTKDGNVPELGSQSSENYTVESAKDDAGVTSDSSVKSFGFVGESYEVILEACWSSPVHARRLTRFHGPTKCNRDHSIANERAFVTMNAAVSKNTRCPNQKAHRVGRVKEKYNDERSVSARRDRAFEWYNRFAYPPYDDFLVKLARERGMNITKDDVDLLPWTLQSGVLLVDRSTMMRIKLGQCNQHKAFVWYHKLGKPTRATFDVALEESQGMDGLKSRDIASLPWDPLQQTLRYSKFHEDDDDCNNGTPEDDGSDSDTEDLTDDSLSSDDRGDVESRRKRARDWYDTLQKPTRHVFRKIASDANIPEIVSKADIDLLPWNESFQFLLTDQNENVSPRRQRAVLDLARRKVEEEAERRRLEEERATAERQRQHEEAAEKQRMEAEATERRHRERLEERRREDERKRKEKEEEEVKRQTEAAAAEKKRKQLEDELEQRRLETLQRQREEAEAERLRVEAALEAERKAEEEQWRMETLQRQREKAERLRVEEEMEAQRRREQESERRRVQLEQEKAEVKRRDLEVAEALQKKEREEAALQREAAEERERELEYEMRQHKLKEMEKQRLGSSRRTQENRSPERNLAERKLRRQESERRRQRQAAEVAPNRIDVAEALQHNTVEVHDRHHRADHRPVRENDTAAQEKRHHSPTRKQQSTYATAEGRFLQIYAWYQRMGQPDRENFKRRLAGMPDIGLVPDDADLLPWAHRGAWVNVRLVQKMVRDYTNAEKARGNQLPWDRATCV